MLVHGIKRASAGHSVCGVFIGGKSDLEAVHTCLVIVSFSVKQE